jgi:hypothetical protein
LSSLHDDTEDGRTAAVPSPAKGKRGKGKKTEKESADNSTAAFAAVNAGAGTAGFFAAPQLKVLFGLTDERYDGQSLSFLVSHIL